MLSVKLTRTLLLFSAGLFWAASAQAAPGYHVIKRLPLGGEGGWDRLTLDSEARRLYVPRDSHVLVVDIDADRIAGDIPDTPGVHGVALAPEFGRGFTSNGRENAATIFDLKSLAILGKVKTGQNPDAIVYDSASKRVFVFNKSSRDATVFDARSGASGGVMALDGKPESAAADGQGRLYVNLKDKREVIELDARRLAVTRRVFLGAGVKPTGLGLDPVRRRVFSGCRNQIMTIADMQTGALIATVPIGAGVDGNAYDPETGLAFSANGLDGTLTVVRESEPGKFEVAETVPTQRGARTLALDPKTHYLYLPTAQLSLRPASAPAPEGRRPKPQIVKDTFEILVLGRE